MYRLMFVQLAQDLLRSAFAAVMVWLRRLNRTFLLRHCTGEEGSCFYHRLGTTMDVNSRARYITVDTFYSMDITELQQRIGRFICRSYEMNTPSMSVQITHFVSGLQDIFHERLQKIQGVEMAYKSKLRSEWTFANIVLTSEQRDEFQTYLNDPSTDGYELLGIVIEQGYKFSASYDPEHNAWIATLTGTPLSRENDKTSMSSRHQTLYEAVTLACFKHLVVSKGGVWADNNPRASWG